MSLPKIDVWYVMESHDWAFNNEEIDEGAYFYIGEVDKNNKPNGYGFRYIKDLQTVSLNYRSNGLCYGKGLSLSDTCLSIGIFNDGNWNGPGVDTFVNGSKYEGLWKNGKKDGYGKFLYPDGRTYEGGWENELNNGYGISR